MENCAGLEANILDTRFTLPLVFNHAGTQAERLSYAMIRRITLKNFMSHIETVIEPADGLTVLVGPNNCGKSAVVAALQILCHNENSTYVTRHGERESAVIVETDDGHTIEWRRKGGSPRYIVDGREFDRLNRSGLPPELQAALRMPKVAAEGNTEFDLHFGEQKSPVFLLDKPPSHAAQFFASSSDAGKLVEMQKLHQRRCRDAERDKARFQEQAEKLKRELAALEPAGDIAERVAGAERGQSELERLAETIRGAAEVHSALRQRGGEFRHCAAKVAALAPLTPPPQLDDVDSLGVSNQQLATAKLNQRRETARARALAGLAEPPKLENTEALYEMLCRWRADSGEVLKSKAELVALNRLRAAPEMSDVDSLASQIERMVGAHASIEKLAKEGRVFAKMNAAPSIENEGPLGQTIQELRNAQSARGGIAKRCAALDALAPVPHIDATDDLARLVSTLKQAELAARRRGAIEKCFGAMNAAPEPVEVLALAADIVEFKSAAGVLAARETELAKAGDDLSAAKAAIESWAENNPTCPTCGGEIDRTRLLAHSDA